MNRSVFRPSVLRALHVFALFNIAIAQPLYEVLAGSPEFFVAHRAAAADVLLMTLLVSFAIPAAVAAFVRVADRISPRAGQALHLLIVGALVFLFGLQAAKHAGADASVAAVSIAAVAAMAAAAGYARLDVVRTFAGLLVPAVAIVPLLFLLKPTVRTFIIPNGPTSAARAVPARTPPIVMVVFDQLPLASLLDREGRIDRRLYPGFAGLGDQATWFRNATAAGDYTGWALPPIVTSLNPRRDTVPSAADFPDSLFTLLAGTYRMHVFEPITSLCPDAICPPDREPLAARLASMAADETIVYLHIIAPRELEARLPPVSQDWKNFAAPKGWLGRWAAARERDRRDQPNRFVELLRRARSDRPSLYMLHTLFPHEPYVYARTGQAFAAAAQPPGLGPREIWRGDDWMVTQNYQAHLVQLGYADALLGRIVDALKQAGVFDDALIVVTADHGARFRPGEPFKHMRKTHAADVMCVPLLIKRPGQRAGSTTDRNVETVDVAATVAAVLGLRLPWKHDGIDALDTRTAERSDKRISITGGRQVIQMPASMLDELRASVDRKLSLFADGDPRFPLTAPGHELIGREVSELHVGTPWPVQFVVDDVYRFSRLDPSADFIPARLTGQARGDSNVPDRLPLAVAVNGRIRATTWTGGANAEWSALVPLDAFRAGRNEIQLFVPRAGEASTVLHPASAPRRPSDLNLLSVAATDMWGVRESGLYGREMNGERMFRWTNGAARLEVPVDRDQPPRSLGVEVEMTGSRQPELRIVVNGCELFRGRVGAGWARTLSLDACPVTGPVASIELQSDSFRPPREERTLGLALASVRLADSP